MLIENIVLTCQSINVVYNYECHVNFREYDSVTCFNSYYNGTK